MEVKTETTAEIAPPPPNPGLKELVMCKNRLQEFVQKAGMLLPSYHTVNEGQSHAPKFRATVLVDGVTYSSPNTFLTRKAAEQDAARVALESLSRKVEIEVPSLIQKDILLCKSILYEYAVKMNLTLPTYKASQAEGKNLPVFSASSFFNGQNFVGETAKSKKEAEQLAARAAIQSVLANPNTKTAMSQIIKSKGKLYSVFGNMDNSSTLFNTDLPLNQKQDHSNSDAKGEAAADETFAPEVKISNQGVKIEPSCETEGNGSSKPALSQGGLVTAMTSSTFNSSNRSPAKNNESDGMKKIGQSVGSENFSGVISGSCRKWSDELEEGGSGSKKARTIELQAPTTYPSRQSSQNP